MDDTLWKLLVTGFYVMNWSSIIYRVGQAYTYGSFCRDESVAEGWWGMGDIS